MKKILILFTLFVSLDTFAQTSASTKFNGDNWVAPYTFTFPKGWDYERFLIPIDFAPTIKYKGVEDLRFMPEFRNPRSDDYWSYVFLWYLDTTTKTNAKIIENNLKAYFTGLVGRNIVPRKIPVDKLITVKTKINKVKPHLGDLKTFHGTIYMLDYLEQKPITLNCIVHFKNCNDNKKSFIFYEISPKPIADNIWQKVNKLWTTFNCEKNTDVQ